MNTLLTLVVVVQVLAALVIIGLVLIQHGKGADMGAAFGSGASGSLFGATGSSNFLSKSTAVAAAVFFAATMALAFFGGHRSAPASGVMDNLQVPAAPAANAAPASAPAAAKDAASQPAPTASTAPASAAGQSNQIPK